MDDDQAKEKARAMKKFQEEHNIRMGSERMVPLAVGSGIAFYILSKRVFGVEKIPYRMIIGLAAYGMGVNIGSKLFGNPHHYVYYTKREHELLSL